MSYLYFNIYYNWVRHVYHTIDTRGYSPKFKIKN